MPCGRGRHVLRIIARMDSTQESDAGSSQEARSPKSQMPETPETIWPLAARRRCYSLRRESQKVIGDPMSGQATSSAVPPTVWPLAVRGHIRRLRKAESAGTDAVCFILDLAVHQV